MTVALPPVARSVLAQLELVSHGTTTSWNSSGGGTSDAAMPPGELRPPHLRHRDRLMDALADPARFDQALTDARAELDQIRGYQATRRADVVGETTEEWEQRLVREGEGWTVQQVANAFCCTKTRVRNVCIRHGVPIVDECLGAAVVEVPVSLGVRDDAVRMRANGMSIRQIAFALGAAKSTVESYLRAAA